MVRGSYSPPSQLVTGSVQGSDSDGNTGLTIGEGVFGLRADGVEQLRGSTQGVTMRQPFVAIDSTDSPFTVQANDFLILVDTSGGSVEINLPSAVTSANLSYIIKDKGAANVNSITVTAAAGNIDGLASIVLQNTRASTRLFSDGANWWDV